MADGFKICPICKTANHPQATLCGTCGASLAQVAVVTSVRTNASATTPSYDFGYGETDLLENSLAKRARLGLFVSLFATLTIVVGLVLVTWLNRESLLPIGESTAEAITLTPVLLVPFATVTEGPPTRTATFTPAPTNTPTETPTPAPCVQRIVAGGSLIGAITNCGHRSLDVLPTVLALNNIADAAQVRIGQEITIPWPTPTPDPNATPAETQMARSFNNSVALNNPLALDTSIDPFAPTATATLPAGVMWHQVAPGDNIITVALAYNANAKVLSELNPEVDFARCEFGERFGGPECLVQLFAGQMLRVPEPTPMPTLSPTPDPNATATPTPTATFNMPNAVSPSNRQFFNVNELIALRWVPSATLRTNEAYRIDVENVTTGERHISLTTDIVFIVPTEWRGKENRRYEYRWQVSIINQSAPDALNYPTEPRLFFWQGTTE